MFGFSVMCKKWNATGILNPPLWGDTVLSVCNTMDADTAATQGTSHSIDLGLDSKVHGANMGSIWGRQDPGGPHVCPMNIAIWGPSCIDALVWATEELINEYHTCTP